GREALARGLGVHDLASIQHRALLKALLAVATREEGARTLRAAGKFFVEGVLPFEMSHRRSQEVNAALRDSEERYRNVVETARDVIFTLASDGKVTSLNPVFESMTGWSRADWIGKDFAPLVDPAVRVRAGGLPRAAAAGRRAGCVGCGSPGALGRPHSLRDGRDGAGARRADRRRPRGGAGHHRSQAGSEGAASSERGPGGRGQAHRPCAA